MVKKIQQESSHTSEKFHLQIEVDQKKIKDLEDKLEKL